MPVLKKVGTFLLAQLDVMNANILTNKLKIIMNDLKPTFKRVNLKISGSLHQTLMEQRAKTDKSINLLIEEAIRQKYETKGL